MCATYYGSVVVEAMVAVQLQPERYEILTITSYVADYENENVTLMSWLTFWLTDGYFYLPES